jgi:6-pyruvoyltetrahydropterin/6-carboxytetrahydropterin synthase
MFKSVKTFGHEVGLSCCFRQWRATHSHCSKLHGYALSLQIEFEANTLDERNWVVDFGGVKDLKESLQQVFDHTLVIAQDDPLISTFRELHLAKACDLVVLPNVGCEAFAEHVFNMATQWLKNHRMTDRVRISRVTVAEHGANSAVYAPDEPSMPVDNLA